MRDKKGVGGQYWNAPLSCVVKYRRAVFCLGCLYLEEHNCYIESFSSLSSKRNTLLGKHIIHIILRKYFHCNQKFHSFAGCPFNKNGQSRATTWEKKSQCLHNENVYTRNNFNHSILIAFTTKTKAQDTTFVFHITEKREHKKPWHEVTAHKERPVSKVINDLYWILNRHPKNQVLSCCEIDSDHLSQVPGPSHHHFHSQHSCFSKIVKSILEVSGRRAGNFPRDDKIIWITFCRIHIYDLI